MLPESRPSGPEPPDDGLPRLVPTLIGDRQTLCISKPLPEKILHNGDAGFSDEVSRFYHAEELEATEKLVNLKATLRNAKTDEFWVTATKGMADLMGAQYAFISKRVIMEDEDANVEMPEYGEPGSCVVGMSIFYDDGKGTSDNYPNMKYQAYGSPCAHMKHDKVLLIPERLSDVIRNNKNPLPEQPEGYLAIPLAAKAPGSEEEKVFGHFGVMWTEFGLSKRKLRYPFLEMCLHSLEGIIVDGFLERGLFASSGRPSAKGVNANAIIPREAISVAQSLKPYARSLSHELRTPMQGVVGMLDVMYATVMEAAEGEKDPRIRQIFETLKENIEIVQDSSRRAVEAADNVVHAYDMNMAVPDLPHSSPEEDDDDDPLQVDEKSESVTRPPLVSAFSDSLAKGQKRLRSSLDHSHGKPGKMPRRFSGDGASASEGSRRSSKESAIGRIGTLGSPTARIAEEDEDSAILELPIEHNIAPGVRHTNIRDVLSFLVNDVLKVGGRPDSAIAEQVEGGEEIEVRQRNAGGQEMIKMVKWHVDPLVPEAILVDERDLAGMISRVFHNALKFTESGEIVINTRLSPKGKYIIVNIRDTGTGIPKAFIPSLFKAFSKEDDSINRQSEGLGLGLMVAKGMARRLNGDLYHVRSETSGSTHGTEFEMRIPVTPTEIISRPGTPFSSPSPAAAARAGQYTASPDPSVQKSPRTRTSPAMRDRALSSPHRRSLSNNGVMRNARPREPSPNKIAGSNDTLTPGNITSQPRRLIDSLQLSPTLPQSTNTSLHRPLPRRISIRQSSPKRTFDRTLATKLPLSFLVVEDNAISRKLLVTMLNQLGYKTIHQAYDGTDAVRQMRDHHRRYLAGEIDYQIDVVLMDLWMPKMDGYEAALCIQKGANGYRDSPQENGLVSKATRKLSAGGPVGSMDHDISGWKLPVILAVTADVTDEAWDRAARVGMKGPLSKPHTTLDLERSLWEWCSNHSPLLSGPHQVPHGLPTDPDAMVA